MLETYFLLAICFGNPIQCNINSEVEYASMEVCQGIGKEFWNQGGVTAYACSEMSREVVEDV